ncbi:MAG: flgK [Rhodospirillales bacterium]|nr:flgK [Rhodospirillales bacterium]
MSLFSILSNATTALLNTQAQINVVSSNIGNAQNPNYSQRSATVIDRSPQNGGSTQIVDVTRAVDGTLQTNYLNQTSNSAASTTVSQLYTQLEQLTGSSTVSPVLSSALQTFQNSWQALQATPEDTNIQAQVLTSAQSLVNTIQTVSHGVEQAASQVTTQLGTDVSTLNSSLTKIATLNQQIASGSHNNQDTTALQDARDQIITTVAGLVPVQQQTNADGTVYLSTPSGVALVQQGANSFAYDATKDSFYAAGDPAKTSLNGALTNGKIGAEIGILANTGAQTPLDVKSLNGYLSQVATINTAIAASGPPAAATGAQTTQLNALTTAIQAQVSATPSVAADGELTLKIGPAATATTLVTGSTTSPLAYNSSTNTLYLASDPTQASLNSAVTSGAIHTDLTSITGGVNQTANGTGVLGNLRAQLNSLADLLYNPANPTAFQTAFNPTATAGSDFFTGTTGGANDRFTLSVNVNSTTLASLIAATPSIAVNVAKTFTATTNSFNAGGVSIGSTNVLGIANAIASSQSSQAAAATSNQTTATANTSAAQQAYRNVTGVSSDQQLAQLVSLQNAYSAAAKIISTVQQLEQTLLTAVG